MISKSDLLRLAGAVFFISMPFSANANDVAPLPNNPQPLEVTAAGDPTNRVGNTVFIALTFKNTSSKNLIITNVSTEIEASANGRFDGGSSCNSDGFGEHRLNPGETYSQVCRFPIPDSQRTATLGFDPSSSPTANSAAATTNGWSSQSWYDSLFSANLRLSVSVTAESGDSKDGNAQSINLRFFPIVPVKASETSIFVGGAVGAMLLAIFVWVERLLKNPEVRERWVRNIFLTLLTGLRGALLSAIALLLGQTTQGVGSPVVLTVSDFSGGVLIGLFSYPLAAWISSTLKLDGVFVPSSKKSDSARFSNRTMIRDTSTPQ
ncbi:MAG: hypothetical protein E2602_05925 [Achromobacter sp.]|nr:hypothetical protein [Achromobacter sp.]